MRKLNIALLCLIWFDLLFVYVNMSTIAIAFIIYTDNSVVFIYSECVAYDADNYYHYLFLLVCFYYTFVPLM